MDALVKAFAQAVKRRLDGGAATVRAIFDAGYYLRQYPDVAEAGVDPLEHFKNAGWIDRRNPCALFDTEYYLEHNPDVALSGLNPLVHYVRSGAREGRQVSLLFDAQWYLAKNPDVAQARVNPLWHYLKRGAAEGREANPLFDQVWYLARYPNATREATCALAHYAEFGARDRLSPHPLFDGAYYLENNPDVAATGVNPLVHYLARGHEEPRQPHPLFDSQWYISQYPDVSALGTNPLLHFLAKGARERRNPNPEFDSAKYLAAHPEVARAGINPLLHYVWEMSGGHRAQARQPSGEHAQNLEAARQVSHSSTRSEAKRTLAPKRHDARLQHSIDHSSIDDDGFAIASGWVEGLTKRTLEVRPVKGGAHAKWRIKCVKRPDVAQHLAAQGKRSAPAGDGFVVAIQHTGPSDQFSLVAVNQETGVIDFETPLRFSTRYTRAEQIAALTVHLGQLSSKRVRDFSDLYEVAASTKNPAPGVAEVLKYGPEPCRKPTISAIVPFYRDYSYLLEHLNHQSLPGGEDIEWVLVCDDPTIAEDMTTFLDRRRKMIAAPTKLIILDANGGYGHANNLGAQYADAETILLLNSDVYMDDLTLVLSGTTLLRRDEEVGCVGFTLLFEDGTIQHDGISLEPLSDWNGLYIARHRRKGAHAEFAIQEAPAECQAVTGAAMLMRRGEFIALNGFDPSYIVGDFEDADLCLKLRERGKKVVLMRGPGLYHLERQSLRYIGDDAHRAGLTLANCIFFNSRWADRLVASRAP